MRRQRFAATYVLPTEVAECIRGHFPQSFDTGPVFHGLRQWLRLRILTDEPMGMPSLAVEAALDRFLSFDEVVASFRQGTGKFRHAGLFEQREIPSEATGAAMALTWAMACNDQHKRPRAPQGLPWLFAADNELQPGFGWRWTMYCGHEPCQKAGHCIQHDLLPRLPGSIPKQKYFGVRPLPLQDKSNDLFTPGSYNA